MVCGSSPARSALAVRQWRPDSPPGKLPAWFLSDVAEEHPLVLPPTFRLEGVFRLALETEPAREPAGHRAVSNGMDSSSP